jgi:aminoglycoside phosphotransferase (APT) family kinase protein
MQSIGLVAASTELSATLLLGGRSNLTYLVRSNDQLWVVRRPPLGHVLETAHDMSREYRVMSALQGTDVPVPAGIALCDDESVIGAPFYLMEFVEGIAFRRAEELEALGIERTRSIGFTMMSTLARLHAVDPRSVGLDGLGRPQRFLERQLQRWKTQLESSCSRPLPASKDLHRRLEAVLPASITSGIVHGDYGLGNLLMDDEGAVRAIVDWEMATLGDTRTDLGLLVAYQGMARLSEGSDRRSAYLAAGYPHARELIDAYSEATGTALDPLGFYVGLGYYKLAGILEGVHFRYVNGLTVGEGFETVGEMTEPTLEMGLAAVADFS